MTDLRSRPQSAGPLGEVRGAGFVMRPTPVGGIEAWSVDRLPFEPTGEALAFRSALRSALSRVPGSSGSVLHATYTSASRAFVDVENALIYNVGTGAFARLAGNGLVVERRFNEPPGPPAQAMGFAHYYRYDLEPSPGHWDYWHQGEPAATFTSSISPVTSDTPLAVVWAAIRTGTVHLRHQVQPTTPFALSLRLEVADGRSINLAAIVKPIVDGVISALHRHDGALGPELVGPIARRTGLAPVEVTALLQSDEVAALGPRRLIWARAAGVQWNPADDQLVALTLSFDRSNSAARESDRWRLSGSLGLCDANV